MGKSKQLTVVERARITNFYEENCLLCMITQKIKNHRITVRDTITLYNETGHYDDRIKAGRPKVTNFGKRQFIRLMSKVNRRLTSTG